MKQITVTALVKIKTEPITIMVPDDCDSDMFYEELERTFREDGITFDDMEVEDTFVIVEENI